MAISVRTPGSDPFDLEAALSVDRFEAVSVAPSPWPACITEALRPSPPQGPGGVRLHLQPELDTQAGYSVCFTTLDDMARNLKEAEGAGRFAKKPQTYLKPAVLVLDEVGSLPLSRAEGNIGVPAGVPALRAELDHPDLEQDLRGNGTGVRDEALASAILDWFSSPGKRAPCP